MGLRRATTVLAALLAVALSLPAPHAQARSPEPRLSVPRETLRAALDCDSSIRNAERDPVLLVHGTGITPEESWATNFSKTLPAAGYSVCTVRLPERALGDIQVASEYVVHAVRVMARTSGRQVDVIGHSQGGIEPRWALRWWPSLRRLVDDYVGLASPNHGIVAADLCAGSGSCWPAVWQVASGSAFIAALNSGDETPGSVSYTNIYSVTDELVQPAAPTATSVLAGGWNVTNVAVQDLCPGRPVHHVGLLHDAVVHALVSAALDRAGPADPADVPVTTCLEALAPGLEPQDAAGANADVYGNGGRAFSEHPGVPEEPPLAPYVRR